MACRIKDGQVFVADSYNHKVTIARSFFGGFASGDVFNKKMAVEYGALEEGREKREGGGGEREGSEGRGGEREESEGGGGEREESEGGGGEREESEGGGGEREESERGSRNGFYHTHLMKATPISLKPHPSLNTHCSGQVWAI